VQFYVDLRIIGYMAQHVVKAGVDPNMFQKIRKQLVEEEMKV